MAVTSEWEWITINRSVEDSTFGGAMVTRRNWTLSRKRISDAAYSSEDGTLQNSLSGYNGGVTETITCPTLRMVTFGTATNWTATTTKWVETLYVMNGFPVYTPYNAKLRLDDPLYLILLSQNLTEANAGKGVWGISLYSMSLNYIKYWTDYSIRAAEYNYTTTSPVYASVNGKIIAYQSGNYFTVPSTATLNTAGQLGFMCTSDTQDYPDQGVDWFTQTQTWTYKEPWQAF